MAKWWIGAVACGASAMLATAALAQQAAAPIVGMAEVVDSDTLKIGDTTILLYGLESLEKPQLCSIDGKQWQCFEAAVRKLQTLSSVAEVSCEPKAAPDARGRVLAVCSAGGTNINEAYVRSGFAVAMRTESKDYVAAEDAAHGEKIGLWQGQFQMPRDFRRAHLVTVDRP